MFSNTRRTSFLRCGAITLGLALSAACSSTSESSTPRTEADARVSNEGGYPVSIENCNRTITFDAAPESVVSLWQAPSEMLLALGLEDHIAAVAGSYTTFPSDVKEAAEGITEIGTSMGWPSKEVLLSQNPDLVIGQVLDGFAFDTSQGYASVEQIESGGGQVYGANSCTTPGNQEMTLDTPANTIEDLGAIFDVRDRAEAITSAMAVQKQKIVDAVRGLPTQKVAYYNGGQGPLIVLAGGIYDDAIETAGGANVFPPDSLYVSKEEFAATDADVILVGTFDGQDFQSQRDYLAATFPELPAVQSGRLVEVPVADTDASITVMTGLAEIAAALHPTAGIIVPEK